MACLFSVIDSSIRKSASSRDKVATPGRGAGPEGVAGAEGGAGCDGFVMGEAYAYASRDRKLEGVAPAFQILNMVPVAAMSKLRGDEANIS